MSVRVRIEDQEFVVPCAEGDQNIKWLAIAAVRLYDVMHQHSFALRQRERLVSEAGMILPHAVRQLGPGKPRNGYLDPADTINTTLEDGETVRTARNFLGHSIPYPYPYACACASPYPYP